MGEAVGGRPGRAQSSWNQPHKLAQHQRLFSLFHQRRLGCSALSVCECTARVSLWVWVSGNLGMKEKMYSCIQEKRYSCNTTMFTQGNEKWKKAVTHSSVTQCCFFFFFHWQRKTYVRERSGTWHLNSSVNSQFNLWQVFSSEDGKSVTRVFFPGRAQSTISHANREKYQSFIDAH